MGNTVTLLEKPEMKEKLKIAPEIIVSSDSPAVEPKQIKHIDIEKDGNLLSPRYRTRSDSIDPFTHDLSPGCLNVLQIIFMSFTIAPLRLMSIFTLLFIGKPTLIKGGSLNSTDLGN